MLKVAHEEDEFLRVANRLRNMMNNLWQWRSGDFCPAESWTPPMNLYICGRRLEICFDLAGVDKRTIDLRVEPGRLTIRGTRGAPEPNTREGEDMRIVAMEIDHGPFCRTVPLPMQVDLQRVTSEYTSGFLWVRLPVREHA